MNNHLLSRALFIIMAIIASYVEAGAANRVKQKPVAPKPIDIAATVDSAVIMADDYATALENKPEMAATRLNQLRNFAKGKPAEVNDSICSRLYDFFVHYTEQDKTVSAQAFKDCFLALASEDNPNLGPLYATQLVIARETTDTATIKTYIPLLEDYAHRLGYDYDEELADARKYLRTIRTRRPIREAIAGVWVSEDVAGYFGENSWRGNYKEEFPLVGTLKIVQFRDTRFPYDNLQYLMSLDSINRVSELQNQSLDVIKIKKEMDGLGTLGSKDYCILMPWDLPAHNMQPLDSTYIISVCTDGYWNLYCTDSEKQKNKQSVIDDDSYSVYAFWGDEKLKRGDPEIAAIIRQTTQNSQAMVAGELARSKYKFGDRLAGNLTAGLVSAGVNSIVDAMMVSTDRIWSVEATFHMVNPYCLVADIYATLIEAKSNSSTPKQYNYFHQAKYYRWEDTDNVNFVGTLNRYFEQPWSLCGAYFLHGITKDEKKDAKTRRKALEDEFKTWFKAECQTYKDKLKSLKKDSQEYKDVKKEFEDFKDDKTAPYAWVEWNKAALAKLKAKSDNYELKMSN